MNFSNKICLLCLENDNSLLEIYGKQGNDLNVGGILQEHFWFEAGTFTATKICENCWKKVESFHIFYNFVKSIHQQHTFETKATIDNDVVCSIKEEPIDIKDIFIDFHDDTDSPAPICDEFKVDGGTTEGPVAIKRKTSRKRSASPPANRYQTDAHLDDSVTTKGPATVKHKTRKYTRKRPASPSANRSKIDAYTSLLSQYFNMACDLCDTLLPSFRETKKHYKDVHNRIGYLICCNNKYYIPNHMLSHCEWHMNPDAFKCNQCPMTFREVYSFRRHSLELHAPETEKKFECNHCDEKFSRQWFLNNHQRNRHRSFKCPICQQCFTSKVNLRFHIRDDHSSEDEREFRNNMKSQTKVNQVKEEAKQFVCDICGNRFVLLSQLRSHINRIHVHRNFRRNVNGDVNSYICEICAKSFKSRQAHEKHYFNVHTNKVEDKGERFQCDICGKWFKHKAGLYGHMRWHNSKPATCEICGRVSSNQIALKKHIQKVHQEASLECVVCGKMFKVKKLLKEHEAIHAGITDLYSCTFCTKTFRSSANMYSHRKRAHPAEVEKMRKK